MSDYEPGIEQEDAEQISPWLKATLADVEAVDFEQPIKGSATAQCRELADLYRSASQAGEAGDDGTNDLANVRVWDLLWGVAGMYFKPADTNEPFGPMLTLANGRRSATASDFRGHADVLRALARGAENVVLKARLSDLVWLIDRKQYDFGVKALEAYVEIVRRIEAGELKFGYGSDDWQFHHETQEYLLRALGLARMLGWSKPEALAAQAQLVAVRKRAVKARDPVPVHWFCELDLRTRVSNPEEVAAELEEVLADLPKDVSHHVVVDLLRLSASAYHMAKREDDKHRCQVAAAEAMVAQADKTSSAMVASHLIGNAIAALHGIPIAKARRLELRHRLVEVQARIDEEFGSFSQEVDLSELVARIQEQVRPLNVFDSLFLFAMIDRSPDPEKLVADATQLIRQFPLSSLFGSAHLDDEGKVIHRTGSANLGAADDSLIAEKIAHGESIRRYVLVSGRLEPARHTMTEVHYLSDDVFYALTSQSPFIPPDLAQTFARGFTRFFQGDFTSALYILTLLLENSLRHVLKMAGHDVTTFDNAGQTQEDRTITGLFEGLRTELDANFTRAITEDIDRVFLGRPGPAISHGVAHGLLHDGSAYGPDSIYACWLIFRLCLLPLYPYRNELGLL